MTIETDETAQRVAEARRFLDMLDPTATVFDFAFLHPDGRKPKRERFDLEDAIASGFNDEGYGVFVTINATDGKGFKKENVNRIRAVSADWDNGIPTDSPLPPSIIVETSPGKQHWYWLPADEMELAEFDVVQGAIAKLPGADGSVKDRPRVMRLPGFDHTKGERHPVTILHPAKGEEPTRYTTAKLMAAFAPKAEVAGSKAIVVSNDRLERGAVTIAKLAEVSDRDAFDLELYRAALTHLDADDREVWVTVGMAGYHASSGSSAAFKAWVEWAKQSEKFDAADAKKRWDGFKKSDGALLGLGTVVARARERGFDDHEWRQQHRRPKHARKPEGTAIALAPVRDANTTVTEDGLIARKLSRRNMRNIRWLWDSRVAVGAINVVFGHSSQGKSTFLADMIARVTTGKALYGHEGAATIGSVIMLGGEEDTDGTVTPRIVAAGGNEGKVWTVDQTTTTMPDGTTAVLTVDMMRDIGKVERLIATLGDVKLLVIDPLNNFIGNVDGNGNSDLRNVLTPLKAMAERHGIAVLIVGHTRKGADGFAVERLAGSSALQQVARSVMIVGTHPEDGAKDFPRRVLMSVKTNEIPQPLCDVFTIESATLEGDGEVIRTRKIEWQGSARGFTAEDVLDAKAVAKAAAKPKRGDKAAEWLASFMKPGKKYLTKEVQEAASANAISLDALKEAYPILGIKPFAEGMPAKWFVQMHRKALDRYRLGAPGAAAPEAYNPL